MPLVDELGEEVLRRIRAQSRKPLPRRFGRGHFETWLSRIGEDQPDLDAAENLENRHLFQLCSEALAGALSDRVLVSREETIGKRWLQELMALLHIRRGTAISFNQDTLVEIAAAHAGLVSWTRRTPFSTLPAIGWWDVLNGRPARPLGTWDSFREPEQTFRLLKLHGSIHWYWQPGDSSGATVASWTPQGLDSSDPVDPDEQAAIERWLPGRVPLIVPPASSKSAFYRVPLLGQLWRDARAALVAPDVHVGLLGYSLPITDLVTSGMLKEALGGRPDVFVDVVNPRPKPVSKNVRALGVRGRLITESRSLEEFVISYRERAAREVANAFRIQSGLERDALLLVGQSLAGSLKVLDVKTAGSEVELVLQPDAPPYTATNISPAVSSPPKALGELLDVLEGSDATRIVAVTSDGARHVVIGAMELISQVGAGNGHWQVLLTALSPGQRRD